MKVRYYLTGVSLIIAVACVGAALSVPKQSEYMNWASLKYPNEAQNVKVDTSMKAYGILNVFQTSSDADTTKVMGLFDHFIMLSHTFH